MGENENNQNLLRLLKELAELQANNMKLQAAIFVKEAKEQVAGKVTEFATDLKKSAVEYGKKAEQYAEGLHQEYLQGKADEENIIAQYEAALEEINEQYDAEMKEIFEEQELYEEEETRCIRNIHILKLDRKAVLDSDEHKHEVIRAKQLQAEISQAIKDNDFDSAEAKMAELKEIKDNSPIVNVNAEIKEAQARRAECKDIIFSCKESIKECQAERKNAIERATDRKDRQLAPVDERAAVRRFLGSFLNKINGLNRFKNNVIAKAKKQIEQIVTETIPEIKQKIDEKRAEAEERKNAIKERTTEIINSGKSKIDNAKEKISEEVESKKEAISEAFQKGKDAFDSQKEKVTGAIEDSKEKASNVIGERTEKVSSVINEGKEKFSSIVEEGKENASAVIETGKIKAADAVTKRKEGALQTYNSIIQKGKDAKEGIRANLQQKIDSSKERAEELEEQSKPRGKHFAHNQQQGEER